MPIAQLHGRVLTCLYDVVLAACFRDRTLKRRLIAGAHVQAGHRVLDLGCGTGTLLVQLHSASQGVAAIGVDSGATMLARARRKACWGPVALLQGRAEALPFAAATFDRVLSTFLFHHLSATGKVAALGEVERILKSGGELHLMDWGPPASVAMYGAALAMRMLEGFENTEDNVSGRLPRIMDAAGFEAVAEVERRATLLGTVSFYSAIKP